MPSIFLLLLALAVLAPSETFADRTDSEEKVSKWTVCSIHVRTFKARVDRIHAEVLRLSREVREEGDRLGAELSDNVPPEYLESIASELAGLRRRISSLHLYKRQYPSKSASKLWDVVYVYVDTLATLVGNLTEVNQETNKKLRDCHRGLDTAPLRIEIVRSIRLVSYLVDSFINLGKER